MEYGTTAEQQPLLENQGRYSEEEQTVKSRLQRYLESKAFHKFVLSLIVIDAICVLADLSYTFLSNENCTPADAEEGPVWLSVLSHISLVITTVFLLEIPLSLYAFGISHYNPFSGVPHASLHLFDAIVIITTFVLEAILRGREQELVGLLVLFRLWRLVKLVGGMAAGAGEFEEELSRDLAEARAQVNEYKMALEKSQSENLAMRDRLSSLENSNLDSTDTTG